MIVFYFISISTLIYNWQSIIWYLFYIFSYFQLIICPKEIKNEGSINYVAVDKNFKTVKIFLYYKRYSLSCNRTPHINIMKIV